MGRVIAYLRMIIHAVLAYACIKSGHVYQGIAIIWLGAWLEITIHVLACTIVAVDSQATKITDTNNAVLGIWRLLTETKQPDNSYDGCDE